MGICIASGGVVAYLAVSSFTLQWMHTVEHSAWEEDWRIATGNRLELVEARVKGSGAGMEPPDGARLESGWWRYRPNLRSLDTVRLADLGGAAGRWRVCTGGGACQEIGSGRAPTDDRHDGIVITACDEAPTAVP
ncbi:MAG: DUF1850 domain-containing protein [Hyphomicrobiaceae bacterium]|nr:DUF1850 domain-containing protein [Hyphomicrobiaceae bacterium]